MRGTVGNSGGEGLKKGTAWRVNLGLIYYILNWFDWGGVDSGYKGIRVKDWVDYGFCLLDQVKWASWVRFWTRLYVAWTCNVLVVDFKG